MRPCGVSLRRWVRLQAAGGGLTPCPIATVRSGRTTPHYEAPIAYPVACLPQAWAAGAPFMILQACLGLKIDGWRGEIHVQQSQLPIGR
jgi:hypothetical protein